MVQPTRARLSSSQATMTSASAGDPFSPRSSVGSASTDSSCLPRRRIRCSKSQIAVGDCRYESASDALLDYLKQFEEAGVGNKDEQAVTTPRSTAASLCSNGLVNGTVSVGLTAASEARKDKRPNGDCKVPLHRKVMGKGLAGSGLVLGSHGIAVVGAREDVEDLLTSKVSPQLQEEVTDTLREVKLRRLLKQAALKSKNQTKTGLQQEVEAALIRSAELLEKVTKEDIFSSQSSPAVETSSVVSPNSSTLNLELEALVLGNTTLLEESVPLGRGVGDKEEELPGSLTSSPRRSGHTYSYHTCRPSRTRQRSDQDASLLGSTSRFAPVSYTARSRTIRRPRASSVDSLLPAQNTSLNTTLQILLNPKDSDSKQEVLCSPRSSDSVPSNQSDPTDLLRHIRSRSMSPGVVLTSNRSRRGQVSFRAASVPGLLPGTELEGPDWVGQLDDSVSKSVPSWVGEINSSQVSDSVWLHNALLQDENNKRPAVMNTKSSKVPSWVGQAEESDINDEEELSDMSRPALVPLMSTPIKPIGTSGNAEWTLNAMKDITVTADNYSSLNHADADVVNDPRPVLNFPDLKPSVPRSPNNSTTYSNNNTSSASIKHVTFTDEPSNLLMSPPTQSGAIKSQTVRSSSPHINMKSSRLEMSAPAVSRVLDSDYNGEAVLRNSILPQTARLRRSMDTFAASSENLRRRSASSSGSSEGSGGGAASHVTTRCSSLDTVALLTGKPLTRSQRQVLNGDAGAAAGDDAAGRGLDLESSSDGLDGDRPWERMVNTLKAPVPVGRENNHIEPSNTQHSHQPLENMLSGGRQPGSMEALKNMLFKLQAEETSTQDGSGRRGEDLSTSGQNRTEASIAVIPALENYDFKQEPGGHSLEKALVHLNRLKKLVKTTPSTSSSVAGSEIRTATTAANAITSKLS